VNCIEGQNILGATDYPRQDRFPDAANMIKHMGLPAETLRKIFVESAKRNYGLK